MTYILIIEGCYSRGGFGELGRSNTNSRGVHLRL
jgi:hypothetical protein